MGTVRTLTSDARNDVPIRQIDVPRCSGKMYK
jgi:hypothetical protein